MAVLVYVCVGGETSPLFLNGLALTLLPFLIMTETAPAKEKASTQEAYILVLPAVGSTTAEFSVGTQNNLQPVQCYPMTGPQKGVQQLGQGI